MRVVIAHRTVGLAQQSDTSNVFTCSPQPVHDVGDFLAQRGGRGRLAVRVCEHGRRREIVRERGKPRDDGVEGGNDLLPPENGEGKLVVLAAARLGRTRLIDNIEVERE